MRFLLLFVVCLCNIVNYMHNSTIAIALVLMCDPSCENLLLRTNDTRIVTDHHMKPNKYSHEYYHHPNIDYMEYAGDVSSIALNFLYLSEEGMKHMDNDTLVIECTWEQIKNCKNLKWSHQVKAFVLSASFWSSLMFQIPCGILINRYGGYWIMLVSVALIGTIDAFLPIAAHYSVSVVITLRFILGLLLTASAPASYKLIEEWMTARDKSISIAMIIASQTLGNVIILTSSGYLVDSRYDWSVIFYISSVTSLVVFVIFALIGRDKPHQVKWMSQVEVNLINDDKLKRISSTTCSTASEESVAKNNSTPETPSIPWSKVVTNKSYLSLLFFIFCTSANNTIYTTELPSFLDQVSDVSIVTNGLLSGLANLTRIFAILLSGFLSEQLIIRDYLSRTSVRKLFSTLLGFGQSICLTILPFVTKNTLAMSTLVLLATFTSGMSSGSTLPLHFELSLNYSVVLITISNTIANINGILVPLAVSFVQSYFSYNLITGWIIILLTAAAFVSLANIFFLICVRAERQPFDFVDQQ